MEHAARPDAEGPRSLAERVAGACHQVTRLAARTFSVPMVMISVVEAQQPRLAASTGIDAQYRTQALTLCSAALGARGLLIIPDTVHHDQLAFAMTNEPRVRFYAGAPLMSSEGHIVGTLCIMDVHPRTTFTRADRSALTDLAALVVTIIEAHRNESVAHREAEVSQHRTAQLRDALTVSELIAAVHDLSTLDLPPEDLLPHVVELISSALDVDWGGLMSVEGDAGTLLSHWHRSPGGRFVTTVGHRVRRERGGLVWQAAQQHDPVFVDHYATHPGVRRDLAQAGGRAVVSAHLGQSGGTTFVMTLVRLTNDQPWTFRDRQLVQAALDAVRLSVRQVAHRAALRSSEARLRLALDAAPVILWATDMNGVFMLSEGRGLRGLGFAPGEAIGHSVHEVYRNHPVILANAAQALAGASLSDRVEAGGRIFEARYAPLLDAQGLQIGTVGTAYDITDTVQAQRQAEVLLDLSQVLDGSVNAPLADQAGAALKALGQVFGDGWLTLWQRHGDLFLPTAQYGDAAPAVRATQQRGIPVSRYEAFGVLSGQAVFLTPDRLPEDARRDGLRGAAILPVFLELPGQEAVLAAYRGQGFERWSTFEQEVLEAAARILSVTAHRRMQVWQLQQAAVTDSLTGLGNRRAFEAHLQDELTRATPQGRFALLSIDLDGLKAVNDREGHERGDALLRMFAKTLRGNLRLARAYRIGGDEFMVLLPEGAEQDMATVLQGIDAAVERVRAAGFVQVGASMGVAWFPVDGQDAGALMQVSDSRMYEQKAGKRGR